MNTQTPTEALRLVPNVVLDRLTEVMIDCKADGSYLLSESVANEHGEDLQALLNAYRALAAPASPLPEGGGDDPHERWSISNHIGGIWTEENFSTEREANAYLDRWKRENPKMDLSRHKVIPVLVTITAAPTGAK